MKYNVQEQIWNGTFYPIFGFLQENIHHNSMFEKYVLCHYENIETNHNLQTSHILCLNETKLKTK